VDRIALNHFAGLSYLGANLLCMSNYRQCKTFLINAFLTLEDDCPEDERLRRAIEQLLEAVARTERGARLSNVVRLATPTNGAVGLHLRTPRA
jgi:hypothetical protein